MADENGPFKCPQCGTPGKVLMRRGPLTHATREELVKTLARVICAGAGNDSDLLWEAFKPQAKAVLRFMGFEELL